MGETIFWSKGVGKLSKIHYKAFSIASQPSKENLMGVGRLRMYFI